MEYATFHDISYAQGLYNMDSDPSPIVEMKMTGFYYGSKQPYTDVQGARNYANTISHGKIPILYHFAGGADPIVEADYFVNVGASPLADGDIYELDYELTTDMGPPADPDSWCRAFMDRVHERTGVYPLLYINTSTFLAHNKFPKTMEVSGLIIADYRYTPAQDVPCGHPYIIHQYTDTPIDTNALFIPIDTLKKYARGGNNAPAPTTTTTTTQAPQPEPTTTTTTTEAPEPNPPEPTTTTTTTEKPQPEPSPSTTTTTTESPATGQSPITFIVALVKPIWVFLLAVFNRLKGSSNG